MELVGGIIAVIFAIALMPVVLYTGFMIVTMAFGIVMIPVAWIFSALEIMRTKKEVARKEKEFESMKARVKEVNERFRKRMQ